MRGPTGTPGGRRGYTPDVRARGTGRRSPADLVRLAALLLGGSLLPGVACAPKACPLVGCDDSFSAQISVSASGVPAGTHTVTVTVDGATTSCSFQFPPDAATLARGVTCSGNAYVGLTAAQTCQSSGGSETCQPVPGQYVESVTVFGTPQSVQVQQTVGGAVILDESVTPSYETYQPNGSGCPPTCQEAAVQWTIPPSDAG